MLEVQFSAKNVTNRYVEFVLLFHRQSSVICFFQGQSIACNFAIKKQRNMKSETRTRNHIFNIVPERLESGLSLQSFCDKEY